MAIGQQMAHYLRALLSPSRTRHAQQARLSSVFLQLLDATLGCSEEGGIEPLLSLHFSSACSARSSLGLFTFSNLDTFCSFRADTPPCLHVFCASSEVRCSSKHITRFPLPTISGQGETSRRERNEAHEEHSNRKICCSAEFAHVPVAHPSSDPCSLYGRGRVPFPILTVSMVLSEQS